MNPRSIFNAFVFVSIICVPCFSENGKIIPLPQEMKTLDGKFVISEKTEIVADDTARTPAELLAEYLRPATGFPLKVNKAKVDGKGNILLAIGNTDAPLGEEGYTLKVTPDEVTITAPGPAGLFYGVQTLRQLLPVEIFGAKNVEGVEWSIPGIEITDKPQFAWRGMMLDVSRYFFNKKFVLRFLDIMAMHKLNVLHWHLIDDAGWRLEIPKYPKLTEIGGFRGKGDQRTGGFYTQDDIREIVKYAADRHITIVPEVEIPAHTLAAVVAYPHLCCTGKQMEVPTRHFISRDLYCAGKDSTWEFLEEVMTDVCKLFPGTFIHIGGDEARYDRWKKCPQCQKKMKELGLTSEKQLQGWMTCRIEKFLQERKKQIVGWDEILGCGVTPGAGIMTWHRPKTAIVGAKRGNKVVMALTGHCYFDTPESKLPGEPPCAKWLPPISVRKAYNWDPLPAGLSEKEAGNILGAEACLWTDQFIHSRGHLIKDKPGEGTGKSESYIEYLAMPRMASLAEVTWTRKQLRGWDHFSPRLGRMLVRYIHSGTNFRMPQPVITSQKKPDGSMVFSGRSPIEGGAVHYTIDGSAPTASSPKLDKEVIVKAKSPFSAVAVSPDGKMISLPYTFMDNSVKQAVHGKKLGNWKAGKVGSREPKEVVFDATGLINSNGTYTIIFQYTGGQHRLDIHRIAVTKNDRDIVAEDKHFGFTGGKSGNNLYRVTIDKYETGASFKVKAWICGDIGNDSNGLVFIKKGL